MQVDAFFDPKKEPPTGSELFKVFTKLALPSIVTSVLAYLGGIVNIAIAGRMDKPIYVAIVGLSVTSTSFVAVFPLIGINAAQDMLTSQAYGFGNLRLCGHFLNRGALILTAIFLPMVFMIALGAEATFNQIGINPELSKLTAKQV